MPRHQKRVDTVPAQTQRPSSPWGWVGTEAVATSGITREQVHRACGVSQDVLDSACPNRFAAVEPVATSADSPASQGSEVIIIDEPHFVCSRKSCKTSPSCLNYLGQDLWENEARLEKLFVKHANLGEDPSQYRRENRVPVGLKNLGATCYANAFLQVWYRIIPFRQAVYSCELPPSEVHNVEGSPIYQLQATFAYLQEGLRSVHNPNKFVESLQLRAGEQQDAQEFSKLFMSHLQREFQKQAQPGLKSLVADQFEGRLAYATTCHGCQNRNERRSEFLELEVNFESDSDITECIANSLAVEVLSGENRYHCSNCNSLQDASRSVVLKKLPSVLHFSLLRFVFDLASLSRQKSKHALSFPKVLDMSQFMDQSDRHPEESHVYDLRGILLHKGPSAYHGHYKAQIYDVQQERWFLFDDETVTEIEALGEPRKDTKAPKGKNTNGSSGTNRPAKRRKIVISDDDGESIPQASVQKDEAQQIFSKDAYMLIYTRRQPEQVKARGAPSQALTLPDPVAQLVQLHNTQFLEECHVYSTTVEQKRARFQQYREDIRNIYRSWDATRCLDADVVSRAALESWLAEDAITAFFTSGQDPAPEEEDRRRISNEDIACTHSGLDPKARDQIKLVSSSALASIQTKTGCSFSPRIVPNDACHRCTETVFLEKLYLQQHPQLIERWDGISDADESFWISKRWLRDWRTVMPKMHVYGENDPSPGAPDFDSHVRCQHGGLSLNRALRKVIPASAVTLLQEIYPDWEPLPAWTEECVICQVSAEKSKDDTARLRKQADEEKGLLTQLFTDLMDDGASVANDCVYVALPRAFTDAWRKWITRPSDNPRPVHAETEQLFCEHGDLNFDPNQSIDLSGSVCLARETEWQILQQRYTAGPVIRLTTVSGPDGTCTFVQEQLSCASCRLRLKTDFTETSLSVLLHGVLPSDPSLLAKTPARPRLNGASSTTATRRSKRLRDTNNSVVRKVIKVMKTSSVKDMKLSIQQCFKIPMLYQAIYYKCRELQNEETVASLLILTNDILDLYHLPEHVDSSDDDKDTAEGPGFGGTLLQGDIGTPEVQGKQCPQCTYLNLEVSRACEICETPLCK